MCLGSPWIMASHRTPEETEALGWAEISGLVHIRPDGSWEMTDFAKDWFNRHPHLLQDKPPAVGGQCPLRRTVVANCLSVGSI